MTTFPGPQFLRRLTLTLTAILGLLPASEATGFKVTEATGSLQITSGQYVLNIEKQGFRYSFRQSSGEIIAPAHSAAGLEFGGAPAATTKLLDSDNQSVRLEVINQAGESAEVTICPSEDFIRFSIVPRRSQPGPIIARTGGIGPAFGLGDLGVRNRDRTELTGYTNDDFHADGNRCGRLISNFAIFPNHGFAEVNIEPAPKIVCLTTNENAQGVKSAVKMPSLFYFFGPPAQIYRSFLQVRNQEGYRVFPPKYEWFGVGWEAFGALAWDTNERTVTENVERYLSLGYPLSWMVVGSGFWPRQEAGTRATTSFGLWDTNLYPHPREFIATAHQRGLKFMLGLRITFITNGPFADEGVQHGYFLRENGAPKVFRIAFPKSPCYLLDAQNPAAVKWYVSLCQKWLAYGVDGFKEDMFGYGQYVFNDDKLDPVNAALMEHGVYLMGRNGYLGSPMDLSRFEDFNQDQNQDRGPLNGLAFAYSGFPDVYPDIVGGTFDSDLKKPPLTSPVMRRYMMRNAQYDSVNPSMAMGMGPWNFQDPQVEQVMLAAARLHARLHPYIYSAARDAYETGFPWTLAPLPLLWPHDPEAAGLENTRRRGYEWMLGPSLLACPLYGDDYATAETRAVYLPAGRWMDYDTGEIYEGSRTLKNFALPPGKTPLFVGGQGIVVERSLDRPELTAIVYPVSPCGTRYQFTHRDGTTRSFIINDAPDLSAAALSVTDTTTHQPVSYTRETPAHAIRFSFIPGHDYEISVPTVSKYKVRAKNLTVLLSANGEIIGTSVNGRTNAVSGQTRLDGCRQVGDAQVKTDLFGGGLEFTRTLRHGTADQTITLKERFQPEGDSIRWEIETVTGGAPWTADIATELNYPATAATRFWTAWSDPEHREGESENPFNGGTWRDPLVLRPLAANAWTFGGHAPTGGYTALPLATLAEPATDSGLSLIFSPEDTVLCGSQLSTTASGAIRFSRKNYRLGGDRPVRFAMNLVAHEADWRGGLRWLVARYPHYFNPPNPHAARMAGCGAYSGSENPVDVAKLKQMAFRINWKLSDDFPYMGMFLPPVTNADEKWDRSCDEKAPPDKPSWTTCRRLNDYAHYMKTNGFYVLDYFNTTEFGKNMDLTPARKPGDPELWKDPRAFLTSQLPGAIFIGGKATCYAASAVDPGDPAFQQHILEQADRHLRWLPDSAGICIDRMDWLDKSNPKADDGVSWIDGRPARALCLSWNNLLGQLGPKMHASDKVIFGNPIYARLDLLRQVDGIYDELGMDGRALNAAAFLGLNKPVLAWTCDETPQQPDPDSFFQRHLLLGIFPTAPYPWNNHCINPSPEADQEFADYGPLLDTLRGKQWVLSPHCVTIAAGTAKANLFQVPGGFALPVIFGGSSGFADVIIQNVPGIGTLKAAVLHPGRNSAIPLSTTTSGNGTTTLRVPLQRGCAMVIFRK